MGRKGKWFDAVHRILTTSQPDHEEKEDKAGRSTDKSNFKKLWQFGKSNSSNASASAAPAETAPPPFSQQQIPLRDQQQAEEIRDAESTETTSEQGDRGHPAAALASSVAAKAAAVIAQTAAAAAGAIAATPRAPARSKEELAAIKIQTACRGYLVVHLRSSRKRIRLFFCYSFPNIFFANLDGFKKKHIRETCNQICLEQFNRIQERRSQQERGQARLMSLLEGVAVKRQTEEALYCMQAMTRVQTQIYSMRVKTEEDKKALKTQIQVKQAPDKTKIGEGWDHSQQSKEQLEGMMAMKQEAASRRQRALSYAFSRQWRNRNPSSGRTATPAPPHPPMFMDPGCPNWGWSWTERRMAAARPWESQTTPDKDRAPAKSAGRAGKPRVSISVQLPTTPTRSVRPPSTPTRPRSPSVSGRTPPPLRVPSPRGSPLHRSASDLRHTTSPQSDQRPAWSSCGSGPRPGSSSPRPRSSQERPGSSSPLQEASLRRTASLRSGQQPRRLSLGSATPSRDVDASETGTPVTPSYMQPTKALRAKTRCTSPSAAAAADNVEVPEGTPRLSSTPLAKKLLSLEFADRASVYSPSTARAERARRQSRPPSPRI